jgi:hypothetical protein
VGQIGSGVTVPLGGLRPSSGLVPRPEVRETVVAPWRVDPGRAHRGAVVARGPVAFGHALSTRARSSGER